MVNPIAYTINNLTAFANDPDRGIGHGISHGLYYGIIMLAFTPILPWWGVVILCVMNHVRVLYQELVIEGWKMKPKVGDFWFDAFCRPCQSDLVVMLAYSPVYLWSVLCPLILLTGYKKKNDWPFFVFWKR